jgi:hypothetical protein
MVHTVVEIVFYVTVYSTEYTTHRTVTRDEYAPLVLTFVVVVVSIRVVHANADTPSPLQSE